MSVWSVWVGGGEVNAFLLSKRKARILAKSYIDYGYDDVQVANYYTGEIIGI